MQKRATAPSTHSTVQVVPLFHSDLVAEGPFVKNALPSARTIVSVRIEDGRLSVHSGLMGAPDVVVRALGQAWLAIVTKKLSPLCAMLWRRLVV